MQTIFLIHNLEVDNFFSQLQLANNFLYEKGNPPDKKIMVHPLQKIFLQPFSVNREPHTAIADLNVTEMACVSWMSGKETSTKKVYFHKEKDCLDAVVTAENLSYLFLMQVLQIN